MNTATPSNAAFALNALLLTLALAGCSKPPSAQSGPLVTAPLQSADAQIIRASLRSGDIQSSYAAHVRNGRIATIDEARSAADGRSAQGTYSFYEARLVKYSGDGIAAVGHEEIEFDLHGAITRSQGGAGPLSTDEVGAIRNRAELLRSHALAKEAVQMHQTN